MKVPGRFLALGVLVFAGLAVATTPQAQPADQRHEPIRIIPVRTVTQTVGETLTMCMYRGARPHPYRVVTSTCRGGGSHCTAFIALNDEEAEMVLLTYDLDYPPVEASGPTCDQPGPPFSSERPAGEVARPG